MINMKEVFFVRRVGDIIPCAVATSKRSAVTIAVEQMMESKSFDVEDLGEVKDQLNSQLKTMGFKNNYIIIPIETNKFLHTKL